VKTLISILAGMVIAGFVFVYLGVRTTCIVRTTVNGAEEQDYGPCVMTVLPDYHINYAGDSWPHAFLPVYVMAAAAGLLVGLILWAVWARR
jgi:hypothetical protein